MSTLNVGIMGCGHIAQKMALTLRRTRGMRAYAAASRDMDKAVGFAKRNRVKHAYGSYAEMLRDKKVDLVYIATPNSEHAANARMCIEAGKPCLVEKPFAINEEQARGVLALAEAHNVFVAEAMWTRYMPFVRTMREVLTSGVIGDPVMLTASLSYPVKSRPRLTDPELGGGTLLDLGIYPINFASMLFGDDILRVEATCSYTPKHLDEQENITFIYRDGRTAALSASMLGAGDRRGMISGTKGYLVVEDINNFEGMTVYNADHGKITTYRRARQKTGYEYELQACRLALSNRWLECPEMTHAQTLKMLHLMDDIRTQLGIMYPCEMTPRFSSPLTGAPTTWQDAGSSPTREATPAEGAPAREPTATRQDEEDAAGMSAPAVCQDKEETASADAVSAAPVISSAGQEEPEETEETGAVTGQEAAKEPEEAGAVTGQEVPEEPEEFFEEKGPGCVIVGNEEASLPDPEDNSMPEETMRVPMPDIPHEMLSSGENSAECRMS